MRRVIRLALPLAAPVAVAAAPPARPGLPASVTFRATEFAFAGPDTIPAGVTAVHLVNAGREPHQLALYRLTPGADAGAVMRTLLASRVRPDGVTKLGGVEAARPGGADSVVVALAPGRYVLACGLPSADGQGHNAKGMLRLLVVRAAPGARPSGALPAADATVRMAEYDFALSAPLRAGPQRLRVENVGRQSHNLLLARLRPGKTKADVDRWQGGPDSPLEPFVGVAALDPGQANVWAVSLAPGEYLLSCVVADARDRRPHFMHGMERYVHVGAPRSRPRAPRGAVGRR